MIHALKIKDYLIAFLCTAVINVCGNGIFLLFLF